MNLENSKGRINITHDTEQEREYLETKNQNVLKKIAQNQSGSQQTTTYIQGGFKYQSPKQNSVHISSPPSTISKLAALCIYPLTRERSPSAIHSLSRRSVADHIT